MSKKVILSGAVGALTIVAFLLGWFLGAVMGTYKERCRRFESEKTLIRSTLKSNHFDDIELLMYTGDGSAMLNGQVSSPEEFDRLRKVVEETVGRLRDVDRMCGVEILKAPRNLNIPENARRNDRENP